MSAFSTGDECSICESSLRTTEVKVTTECGHTFHRQCAQKRLDEREKGDCRICKKPSALAKALRQSESKTTTEQLASHGSKPVQSVCLLFLIQ
jgi:hypothetical protein